MSQVLKNLLLINSSAAHHEDSHSRQLTALFVKQWQAKFPQTLVVNRDISAQPIPHLNAQTLAAIKTNKPLAELNAASQNARHLSDQLVAELQTAQLIILGVPMYNYTIPSALTAYLGYVVRKDVTFGYDTQTQKRVGLLQHKQVIVINTSGGFYDKASMDFQRPYLQAVFNHIGLAEKLTFITAAGLLSPDKDQSLKTAEQMIKDYVANQ